MCLHSVSVLRVAEEQQEEAVRGCIYVQLCIYGVHICVTVYIRVFRGPPPFLPVCASHPPHAPPSLSVRVSACPSLSNTLTVALTGGWQEGAGDRHGGGRGCVYVYVYTNVHVCMHLASDNMYISVTCRGQQQEGGGG